MLSSNEASLPEDARLMDPCFWSTTECEVGGEAPPEKLEATAFVDTFSKPVPCVTTDDGCDLDARLGVVGAEGLAVAGRAIEAPWQHDCWYDQECVVF